MTSGSLWNYCRDEVNDFTNENNNVSNCKTTTSKSYECKANLIGRAPNNNSRLNIEVVVLLKYLSNLRSLSSKYNKIIK